MLDNELLEKCYEHSSCREFQFGARDGHHIAKRGDIFYYALEHNNSIVICKCDEIRGKGTILAEAYKTRHEKEYTDLSDCYLAVNVKGIMFAYLNCYEAEPWEIKPELIIKHFDFRGSLLSEMTLDVSSGYDGKYHRADIGGFYVYDAYFYYASNTSIMQVNMDTCKVTEVYNAGEDDFSCFCVNKNKLIIKKGYKSWCVLDLSNNKIDTLWDQGRFPIHFVNAALGIAWVEAKRENHLYIYSNSIGRKQDDDEEKESVLLIPVDLWGDNKGKPTRQDLLNGIWLPDYDIRSAGIYFDGILAFYRANLYHTFYEISLGSGMHSSSNWYIHWSDQNGGHGNCDRFFVKGDRLFLDIDAEGTKVYRVPYEIVANGKSLGESWPIWSPDGAEWNKFASSSVKSNETKESTDIPYSENLFINSTEVGGYSMGNDSFSDVKIGKLAQTVFRDMLEAGKATEEEVRLMQQADYSKKTFDLQFPVLVRADDFFDSKRYYSKPLTIRGVQYMMCSQWFETAANNDRPYLMAWINKHS